MGSGDNADMKAVRQARGGRKVYHSAPDILGGTVVFVGTRVPVRALFENLEGGARIDDFLEWFQGVTREQAELVLRHAEQSLVA